MKKFVIPAKPILDKLEVLSSDDSPAPKNVKPSLQQLIAKGAP